MKVPTPNPLRRAAFSLVELLVVMAIFSILVAATVSAQIFGLRLYRISETKLVSTSGARNAITHVRDEIRQAKEVEIGMADYTGFTAISNNLPMIGNAVRIFPAAGSSSNIYYYIDTEDQSLKRVVNSGSPLTIAAYITNVMVFQAEDFQGNVVSSNKNNRVISMTLEFFQVASPNVQIGEGGLYDYYRLQTRVARRAID